MTLSALSKSCTLILLFTGAITGQISQAQPQLSGSPDQLRGFLLPQPNTVNISGHGELTAFKDMARISLLVTTEERDLHGAMASNQALRAELIQDFVAAGIGEDDINNSKFASSPQYGLFGRNPNSFEVVARMEVEVSTEDHLQLLAAAADAHSEVEFERIEFEHSEEKSSEREVRELALQDVMEQKEYYEASLGLQLRAVNFYYGGIRQLNRNMPMAARMGMVVEEAAGRGQATLSQAAAPAVAPTFDEVEYQTNITVVFEIISDEQ
ncbi:MAG: SIMPL domain-containing protein [Gammaproteobacteria bacterium]